jgi:ankyrin repeat protein
MIAVFIYADNHDGSIDVPVEDGDTLLHLACLYGHLPCVQVEFIFLLFFRYPIYL